MDLWELKMKMLESCTVDDKIIVWFSPKVKERTLNLKLTSNTSPAYICKKVSDALLLLFNTLLAPSSNLSFKAHFPEKLKKS